ncbi:MAG: hypothetical protein M5T61_20030 [Acidimicrobiia bacterium]|nr:hypothetical protein [Acidimicrobiia bacterium]
MFERLLTKLDEQRRDLGGKVFDVLGEAFSDKSLRDLLIDAIRADDPKLQQARAAAVIDHTIGDRMRELIDAQALLTDILAPEHVDEIHEQMLRPRPASSSLPHVRRFFLEAFGRLGGRSYDAKAAATR